MIESKIIDRVITASMTGGCSLFAMKLCKKNEWGLIQFLDKKGHIIHYACKSPFGIIDAMGSGCRVGWVEQAYKNCGGIKQFDGNWEDAIAIWQDLKDDIYPEFEEELEAFLASDLWQIYQYVDTRKNDKTNNHKSI